MSVGPASTLQLQGSLSEGPAVGSPSGVPQIPIPIDFTWTLTHSGVSKNYDLASDSPQAVSLDSLPSGATHVLIVVTGGHVNVTLTSGAGAAQVIAVNQIALLVSIDQPYTAISLQRATGVEVDVQVYLANGS